MAVAPRVLGAGCKDHWYLVLVEEGLFEVMRVVLGMQASLVLSGCL